MDCDVIGLGLRCLDIVVQVSALPRWGHEREAQRIAVQGGGPAGTAAVAASRMGVRSGYVGTVGSGPLGELKRGTLADYGVDLRCLVRRDAPEQQVSLVFVSDAGGERTFMPARRLLEEPLKVEELDRAYLTAAEILIIDGFHPQAALAAAQWMRQAGKRVIMDLRKPDGPLPTEAPQLARLSDYLIGGEGGLQALTGIADAVQAGKKMLEQGVKVVVETRGERGCLTVTREGYFFTEAFPVTVVNTTGAGDVFHGAYAAGLIEGRDLHSTTRFASAAAALTCTRMDGFERIPDRVAVERLLRQDEGKGED